MKEKKHYAFIQARPESTLEYWYKAKYYVDQILTPLLKEENYEAVDHFVKSDAFMEIADLGILKNIDFSGYVINWWIPVSLRNEKQKTSKNYSSNDVFFFRLVRHIFLNKEASMLLIQWFTVYTHEKDLTGLNNTKYALNETPFFSRFDDEYDEFLKTWINARTSSSEVLGDYVKLWVERESATKLGEGIPRYFRRTIESRTVKYYPEADEFYTWFSDAYYNLDDDFVAKYLNDFTIFTMAYNTSVSPDVRERARAQHIEIVKKQDKPNSTILVALRAGLLNDTETYLEDFPGTENLMVNTTIANFAPLNPWMIEVARDLGKTTEAVFHNGLYPKPFNSYLKLENINPIMDKSYIAGIKQEARLAIGVTGDMYAPDKWVHSILEATI